MVDVKRALGTGALGLLDFAYEKLTRPPRIYPPIPAGGADELPEPFAETLEPVEPERPPIRQQWGLRLPNGNVVWDNSLWLGRSLVTPEDRTILVAMLRKTAAELGFEEKLFLDCYGWASRLGVPSLAWGPIDLVPLVSSTEEKNAGEESTPEVPGE